MKKTNLLLTTFILLSTLISVGQETKKIEIGHENLQDSEIIYVLKKNKKIKHGNYQKFTNKVLVVNGYYKNDLMDSLWTEYFPGTKFIKNQGTFLNDKMNGIWLEYRLIEGQHMLKSKGEFANNFRKGVWEFYNLNSVLFQKYDFDNKQLVYFLPDDKEYEVMTENGLIKTQLERPPVYIGGFNEIVQAFFEELKPLNFVTDGHKNGTLYVSFFINSNGKAVDYVIEKSLSKRSDIEVLRALKLIPDNWLPGYLYGKPVKTKHLVEFSYKKEKNSLILNLSYVLPNSN